jgi:hypothetical protein
MYHTLVGTIIYLHFHIEQTFTITDEMINDHEIKLRNRISDIGQKVADYSLGLTPDDVFSHTPGKHCSRCSFT